MIHVPSLIYRKPGDAESIGSMSGMVDTPLFNPIYDNNNPPDYELVVSTELSKSSPSDSALPYL